MQILDTDTLSYLFNSHPRVLQRLNDTHDLTVITVISKIELLKGRNDLIRAQGLLERTEVFLSNLPTLYFDTRAVEVFRELSKHSSYRKVGRADLLISSIAPANQATLITRNAKDFRKIKNLKLENWID